VRVISQVTFLGGVKNPGFIFPHYKGRLYIQRGGLQTPLRGVLAVRRRPFRGGESPTFCGRNICRSWLVLLYGRRGQDSCGGGYGRTPVGRGIFTPTRLGGTHSFQHGAVQSFTGELGRVSI